MKEIKIDQILLNARQIFLFKEINEKSSLDIVNKLVSLDNIKTDEICLYINSPGGDIDYGFAIIDAIKAIKSHVITIISGHACSMAGVVSIAGDKRLITENSVWMSHDMSGGIHGDYTTKILDRSDYLKREQRRLFDFLKIHTKLSNKELQIAQHGELWLYPEECKEKGIVDKIIKVNKVSAKRRRKK